jgi:hypothetical protein
MYFVQINQLKRDLAAEGWNGSFPYFIAYFILDALVVATWGTFSFEKELALLDGIEAGLYFAVVVGGTVAAYYSNGGRAGKAFLDRYFALAWVLGIRFIITLTPILFVFGYFVWGAEDYPEQTTWPEVVAYVLTMVTYYWRLNVHIRDVSHAKPHEQK